MSKPYDFWQDVMDNNQIMFWVTGKDAITLNPTDEVINDRMDPKTWKAS